MLQVLIVHGRYVFGQYTTDSSFLRIQVENCRELEAERDHSAHVASQNDPGSVIEWSGPLIELVVSAVTALERVAFENR